MDAPLPLPSPDDRLRAARYLRHAHDLIAQEAWWKPGWSFAENVAGAPLDPRDPTAVRFSTAAALRRAGADVSGFTVLLALPFLDCAAGEPVDDYECRAGRTHADMLRVFEEAITLLATPYEADGVDLLFGVSTTAFAGSYAEFLARVTA